MDTKATKSFNAKSLFEREPNGELPLPWRELVETGEGVVLGFHQSMLEITQNDEPVAEVSTGSGLGTDFIRVTYRDKSCVVRGRDLLLAFVKEVAPEDCDELKKAIE